MYTQLSTIEFVEQLKSLGIKALDLATASAILPAVATHSCPGDFFVFIAGQAQVIDMTDVDVLAAKFGLEVRATRDVIQLPSMAGSIDSTGMISKSCAAVQPDSLPRFSKLPKELRTKIYKEALPTRWISAAEMRREVRSGDPNKESKWVITYDVTGAERPAIIKACKEARDDLITTRVYQPLFNVCGTKIGVYFNPQKDVLHLRTDTQPIWGWGPPAPETLFSKALTHHIDADKIQLLELNLTDFERYYEWSLDNINTMTDLTELHITGKIPEMDRLYPDFLHVEFEYVEQPEFLQVDCEPQSIGMTPYTHKADGTILMGVAALSEVFKHIADREHQFRIMELWQALVRGRRLTKKFPARVSVFLEMFPVFQVEYDGY